MTTTVDIGMNKKRAEAAVLLAIHTVGRPVHVDEAIQRVNLVSMSKLKAEASLEEQKILLGWKLDTRILTVSLPFHKLTAWSNGIKKTIEVKRSHFRELEYLISRLGHTTVIIESSLLLDEESRKQEIHNSQ